eukprot:scaffold68846_cov18-Tisochrysis_lutea.AAC.1
MHGRAEACGGRVERSIKGRRSYLFFALVATVIDPPHPARPVVQACGDHTHAHFGILRLLESNMALMDMHGST